MEQRQVAAEPARRQPAIIGEIDGLTGQIGQQYERERLYPGIGTIADHLVRGLAAGLQTRDVTRAHRVAARLDAGIVWVNDWAMLDPAVPFGGVKDSGFGREYGPEALEAYTKVKSVVVSLPQPQ